MNFLIIFSIVLAIAKSDQLSEEEEIEQVTEVQSKDIFIEDLLLTPTRMWIHIALTVKIYPSCEKTSESEPIYPRKVELALMEHDTFFNDVIKLRKVTTWAKGEWIQHMEGFAVDSRAEKTVEPFLAVEEWCPGSKESTRYCVHLSKTRLHTDYTVLLHPRYPRLSCGRYGHKF